MDLDLREREIQEFIVRHKLKAGKHNERAWGSYDLLMNFDPPTPYAFSGDTFGWGFTPEEAMIIFIGRCMDSPAFDENFVKFMGDARMFELSQIKFQVKTEITSGSDSNNG